MAMARAAAITRRMIICHAIMAIFSAARFTMAFAKTSIATSKALLTSTQHGLRVPFAIMALKIHFINGCTNQTGFSRIAKGFTFRHTIFQTARMSIIIHAMGTRVYAIDMVFMMARATMTNSTTIRFIESR